MPALNSTIHVINLDPFADSPRPKITEISRQERINSIVRQSKSQGFAVRFWEGVTGNKNTWTNISQAFKKIITFAKESAYDTITIAEDDLVFTAPGAWEYYCNNTPKEFDTYLGGIYSAQIEDGRIMNGYSGHTLITVHEKFYDFILGANEGDHLDRHLGNTAFKHQYKVCEPFVVKQIGGYSDNLKRVMSYDEYHKQFNYFGL